MASAIADLREQNFHSCDSCMHSPFAANSGAQDREVLMVLVLHGRIGKKYANRRKTIRIIAIQMIYVFNPDEDRAGIDGFSIA